MIRIGEQFMTLCMIINNCLERLGAEVFTGIKDADANWVIVVVDDDMYVFV